MRKIQFIIIIIFSCTLGFWLAHIFNNKKPLPKFNHDRPLVSLSSTKVIALTKRISAIGTVKAVHDIQISPSISGKIQKIYFQSGQRVRQGQLVVELQNEDVKSNLDLDLAKYEFSSHQYKRYKRLLKTGAVALADMDQFKSVMEETRAQYSHDKAILEKTLIRAPFSGEMGIRHIEVGQFINAGMPIVTLEDKSRLLLNFSVPQTYSSLINVGQLVQVSLDPSVNLKTLARVNAIGVKLSENFRFLNVQSELLRSNLSIIPGSYVKLELIFESQTKGVFIPDNAIFILMDGFKSLRD
jgi:RND family efflux transporter MFP subunit